MKLALWSGLLGLILFVWALARCVTVFEIFNQQEIACQEYHDGLKNVVSRKNKSHESPNVESVPYSDIVLLSEINCRMVIGKTLEQIDKRRFYYFIQSCLGVLLLGFSSFWLKSRHRG